MTTEQIDQGQVTADTGDAPTPTMTGTGAVTRGRRKIPRVGVFVCHCGINIAKTVDVERVTAEIAKEPGVVFTTDYTYVCSTPGQQMIVDAIKEHTLDRVIVASCSPKMHELTFRRAAAKGGLNPFLCEMANIRDQCSWVHREDPARATRKAKDLIRMAESAR